MGLAAGRILPPAERLKDHVYEGFLPPPDNACEPLVPMAEAFGDGRLDPLCLMKVDLPTARHTVEYAGRLIAFCAPSCKKTFLADPSAYLSA